MSVLLVSDVEVIFLIERGKERNVKILLVSVRLILLPVVMYTLRKFLRLLAIFSTELNTTSLVNQIVEVIQTLNSFSDKLGNKFCKIFTLN